MKLRVKDVDLSTGGPLIAILNEEDSSKLDLHPLDRIRLTKGKKSVVTGINIAKNHSIRPGEIGLFEEVLHKLNIGHNYLINIDIESRPASVRYIKRKLDGHRLSEKEINIIVKDVVDNELTEVELTYFVSGCYSKGLNLQEIIALTKAIAENGDQLKLDGKIIVDKHSSGGTPGNRTTMVVVPIVAAAGLTIPKTSSRAITSAAGTSDVMEVLAKVSFPVNEIKKIVKKTNACMVWSGTMGLASADDKFIKIEHPLRLDPTGILISSIMAKKKAVNATHVLIDIPWGIGAKIKTKKRALLLRKLFLKVGRKLGIKVDVMLSDGSQPIGNGIGPALEARDVLWILTNNEKGPKDLRDKSIYIAGKILKLAGKGDEKVARKILDSGAAYEKMKEIIKAQEGDPNIKPEKIKIGSYSFDVEAKTNGIFNGYRSKALAKLARIAGAPASKESGVFLHHHKGERVRKGEKLFTIYSDNSRRLEYAIKLLTEEEVTEFE